jgi:hypothetical protein
MTNQRSLGDLMHDLTHRVPGLPPHRDHAPGHQGHPGAAPAPAPTSAPAPAPTSAPAPAPTPAPGSRRHHRPVNQGEPRVLVAWQQRIAAFVGRR